MVLVALEQSEPPGRRLVDDDLAARFLPAPTRWLVTATPPSLMRQLTMATVEREGPGLWASMTCRKRYIADKVTESLDDIDAVVVLGAGFDTLAYRLVRKTGIPIFEVDQPRREDLADPAPPIRRRSWLAATRRDVGVPGI
jgi:methyltransferase (TIGR00027 family)